MMKPKYVDTKRLHKVKVDMELEINGQFWLPETSDVTVGGRLTVRTGEKAVLVLDDGLVEDPRVHANGGGLVFTSSAAEAVASFLPITVHGRLDDGGNVTLVEARNHGGDGRFGYPEYVTHGIVFGGLISGLSQPCSAIRFRFGHPYWLGHLADSPPCVVEGATLRVEASDDGNWLVYEPAEPETIRQLDVLAVMGALTLTRLALDQEFKVRDTQLRAVGSEQWLSVHGPSFDAELADLDPDTLLTREELTLNRLANWIPLNARLDGLASVVAQPIAGPLESQVLVATSLIEGIHRRLPTRFGQSKFPDASNSGLDKIKAAARRAAREKAQDIDGVDVEAARKAVMDAVSHFDAKDYLQRATDIVNDVCTVLPEIRQHVAGLPEKLTRARNEMAHHLIRNYEQEPLSARHLRWIIVTAATPWLLRGLLLLEIGVDPAVLHDRHICYQRFLFFLANTEQHVKELGWDLPEETADRETSSPME